MLWVLTLGWAVIYADRTSLYPLLAIIATLLAFGLFSNSAFTPVMVAWTGDLAGKRYPGSTGAAVGIYNCVIMTSAIIAPLVSGYLRDLTGSLAPAIVVGSAVMLTGTMLLFRIPEINCKKKRTVDQNEQSPYH